MAQSSTGSEEGWAIFEQAMVMLEDLPGETMLERIARLKDYYIQLQELHYKETQRSVALEAERDRLLAAAQRPTHPQLSELDDASNACLELAAKHGYATGHGDTVGDMIREFSAQVACAPMDNAAGIEWFERTFGVPLGDKPGAVDVERVRASVSPAHRNTEAI